MAHPSESQHWYDWAGHPVYEVLAKNGTMRPTTLRDARVLNLVPSVTSVIKCAVAPGLERWKQQQILLAALTLPRIDGEKESEYLDRILFDAREQAIKAAARGTAIHAAIQGHYEGKPPAEEYWEHVQGASDAITRWTDDLRPLTWIAERSFAHELGYGGKIDLINERGLVIDFKTKEFGPEDKLSSWDEHAMQLAAYRQGVGMPTAHCAIVYISTSVPGLVRLIEIEEEKLIRGTRCFSSLFDYWKAKNNYYPVASRDADST